MKRNLLQIAAFALGTGAQAALGFFSVPLLVRLLGVEELGRWSVVEAMFQLGAQIALLGFNPTLIKYISGDGMAPWATLTRVTRALVPSALVVGLIVGICAHWILGLSPGSSLAVGVVLCLECWLVLAFVAARAASMPIIFSSALILRASAILASLALILYSQPTLVRHAGDVPAIWVCIYLLIGLVLGALIKVKSKTGEAPDRQALRNGLKYGFPLLITIALSQVMQTTDRFLVSGFLGFDEAGVYFLHAKIANALAFAALPVQLWWPVARFEHLKDVDGGADFFSQASVWGLAFFGLAAVGLAAIAPHLLRWFAPSLEFKSLLFLVLLLSAYFQTSAIFFNIGLLKEGATHFNVIVWVGAAVAQIFFQLVLLASFGVIGAALGAAVGSSTGLILQYLLSQRISPIRYPVFKLAAISIASIGASFLAAGAIQ